MPRQKTGPMITETATTTTTPQMPSTTPAPPTLNSQADPSADGWSFPLSDEFSLVSQWGLIILACCLSIPAVIAWVLPKFSACARSIANYLFTILASIAWLCVVVTYLREPTTQLLTRKVPKALHQYADTTADILALPLMSILLAVSLFLMFELFWYRSLIFAQVTRLFSSVRELLSKSLLRRDKCKLSSNKFHVICFYNFILCIIV